ncbi:hypothetical protein NDU88_008547 [Pleurodeles waltl]|uniref:Uncharacterized protein n=1 Tax=Pleurodeles waltl TaxID=8319 RepID=A0AAV7PPG3_PLEWA|nr:hypothetical protein NDU88_008547 [Pleurodeles waltl]
MQEDLLLPLRGVGKGWEPKRQATRGQVLARLRKTNGNPAREALLSQSGSAINAPSGDRTSPHHVLRREPAA